MRRANDWRQRLQSVARVRAQAPTGVRGDALAKPAERSCSSRPTTPAWWISSIFADAPVSCVTAPHRRVRCARPPRAPARQAHLSKGTVRSIENASSGWIAICFSSALLPSITTREKGNSSIDRVIRRPRSRDARETHLQASFHSFIARYVTAATETHNCKAFPKTHLLPCCHLSRLQSCDN
jgi:hypothetical protein